MNVELVITGLGWFVLAFGHAVVGLRWVLPNLTGAEHTVRSALVHVGHAALTWNVVSVLLLAFGVLFTTLAWVPHADPKTLLLRWFVALVPAATALAFWEARRRPRSLLRLPVTLVMVVIAVMSWTAST
jgi:hypothetical protein